MTLFGRSDLVGRVSRSRAPVTVLCGDSGVGKSEVLIAAQLATDELGVAPPPRTLRYSGGVLQIALLESLGEAVAIAVERHGRAREVGAFLVAAAQRLAEDRGQQLARVIGRELLAIAKARLGPEVGGALGDYVTELRTEVDENLGARIAAAADPGVLNVVVGFGGEVCSLWPDNDVVLALDAGERMRDEDRRLLADLRGNLPQRLRVVVATSSHGPAQQQHIDFLRTSGVATIQVGGITIDAIVEWLEHEQLDPTLAHDVHRVTGGYPLHIGDLIAHLHDGGTVADGPLNEQFSRRTDEAWRDLDTHSARYARELCVLPDPLPFDDLRDYLGLTPAEYGQVSESLERARLFSVRVNGQRWFHEQRRRYLQDVILGEEERERASTKAVRGLTGLAVRDDDPRWAPAIASLMNKARTLTDADEQLAGVMAMSKTELALAAALLELYEPSTDGGAIGGDELLRYARNQFGAEGDLVAAFTELGQRGFVHTQIADHAAVAVPYMRSAGVLLTIAGRASNDLGRQPIPRAATSAISEILSRAQGFEMAEYGIGSASGEELSERVIALRRMRAPSQFVTPSASGANLLVRGSYATRPLYASITYPDLESRDAMHDALCGLAGTMFGDPYEITSVLKHPLDVVPSRRFMLALERLGYSFGMTPVRADHRFRLETPLSLEDALTRRVDAVKVVRSRMSDTERIAARLERPLSYAFTVNEGVAFSAEVLGGRESLLHVGHLPPDVVRGPFSSFRLAETLELQPNEHVPHWEMNSSSDVEIDPVVEVMALLENRSSAFNQYQRPRPIILDANALKAALTEAAELALADARVLAEGITLGAGRQVAAEARVTYVCVYLDPPSPGLVPGGYSIVHGCFDPAPDGVERVEVAIVKRTPDGDLEDEQSFTDLFGIEDLFTGHSVSFGGQMQSRLAWMLGHSQSEIDFRYPDNSD